MPTEPGSLATEAANPAPALGRAELFSTVFLTGAAVILVEIVGTRVIGPVYGVNLFVWSALLAVTLGSLAVGYYAGGVLVDRTPAPRLLSMVVAAAGVLLGLVPLFRLVVLRAAESLGPRGGPLVAATLLFAPSLLTLGMIGPIAVRLATKEVRFAGHGVGAVYAVSTVGSLAGTMVTSFVLIPAFETDRILEGAAALLLLMGAVPLARRWHRSALATLFLPVLASGGHGSAPPGFSVVDHSQSLYGLVEVIDDVNRGVRLLRVDHSIIGAQWRDGTAAFSFLHILEAVRYLRPAARDMLQLGLGIGSLPSVLAPRGIRADVVEIDPTVVKFAQKYFGFSTQGEVYVEDARTFLRRTERRYDLIVHDTFTGGTTPEHLLSLEVVQRVHDILRPGGVLALNFVGYTNGSNSDATLAVARTLHAVFPSVHAFRDEAAEDRPGEPANLLFFASDEPLDFTVPASARFENKQCEYLLRTFSAWETLRQVPDGPLVTDANNPLARLQLPVAEAHFEAMNGLLPIEMWLH
jgi:hypothetical protein